MLSILLINKVVIQSLPNNRRKRNSKLLVLLVICILIFLFPHSLSHRSLSCPISQLRTLTLTLTFISTISFPSRLLLVTQQLFFFPILIGSDLFQVRSFCFPLFFIPQQNGEHFSCNVFSFYFWLSIFFLSFTFELSFSFFVILPVLLIL